MKRLRVVDFGDAVQGIELRGDPANPEPWHVRLAIPYGDVDLALVNVDGKPEYWVHVRVNHERDGGYVKGETICGRVLDARVDAYGKSGGEIPAGVLADPDLYHLAVRLGPAAPEGK